MNVGYTYNQSLLAGAPTAPMPYSPSYSVPIQSPPGGPAPISPAPMRRDSFESTRDKDVGDVIGGFFSGAGKAVYDMGRGLFFLGKTAGYAIEHPIKSMQKVGGAVIHGVTNPVQTAEMVVTLPWKVAKGVVKPYSNALQQGKYGEALGRFAVDFTVIASSLAERPKPTQPTPTNPTTPPPAVEPPPPPIVEPPPPPPPVSTPVGVSTPGGGVNNTITEEIKDVILENISTINGNNNVVNVGGININIGGVHGSTFGGTTSGGGLSGVTQALNGTEKVAQVVDKVDDVAKVIDNADEIAKVVDKVDDVSSVVSSPAVGTVTSATGSTVGTRIGQGIDFIINAPGKSLDAVGKGIQKIGQGFQNVGNAILHPIETLKGVNPVATTEWLANGIRRGGNAIADGMIFAAHNPKEAMIIAGAVGRAGKAAEDILMEMDLVR